MWLDPDIDVGALADSYAQGDPYPHIVLDGFFADDSLEEIGREIDFLPQSAWRKFANERELKWGLVYPGFQDTPLHHFLASLNSIEFLLFLEQLTGIAGLIPDPYFGGGGVHFIPPGGFLAVHSDFNWHPKLKLDRRINVLIYLNQDWREEYGGHLELWSAERQVCRQRILPVFNRMVIFNTTDDSFHGHPNPLRCPATSGRKSLSAYYYTNGRPAEEKSAPHDTIFLTDHLRLTGRDRVL